ncbi:MAG: SpoIID/LytB domain-containing protein, partial [Armatimonadota bacterium]|nr:SpoIID/LytB domain-containing protein [Armatimonadota bacterium]
MQPLIANETPKQITIQVGLTRNFAGVNCLTLTSTKEFRIIDLSTEDKVYFVKALSKVEISLKDGFITLAIDCEQVGSLKGPVRFEPQDADQIFDIIQPTKVRNKQFRGALIFCGGSTLTIVNEIDLEHYIYGVVANEVPQSFSLESQKALAIAARTYALRNIGRHSEAG